MRNIALYSVYEKFYIFHFQKRIVSVETIRGNTVYLEIIFERFYVALQNWHTDKTGLWKL